jgi:hypothetical protein
MLTEKPPNAPEQTDYQKPAFMCEKCTFVCSKLSDYNRHLLTRKHKRTTNANENTPGDAEIYECKCGIRYQHKSSLSRHKKQCRSTKIETIQNALVTVNEYPNGDLTTAILELVRENQDFKNMLIEQHKTMLQISQQPHTISNSNNHTNSHNKQFNLNFFLNEQCKNAINLSEFIENVKIGLTDLEHIADVGYVDGVTKLFMNGLKELDIYTRPLHCTDIKREIVHVRENNMWIKDTPEQEKIKAAIRRIAFRNIQQISEWNKQHPESEILDTPDFERSFQIMKQSLGDTCHGGVEKNNEKVAKNVMKAVYVDKQYTALTNTMVEHQPLP